MRIVPVEELQPGMVLGRAVYGERGEVLLQGNVILSERYIEALKSRGFRGVYVCNGLADDVEPQEIVSERVRILVRRHVHGLFNLVQHSARKATGRDRLDAAELAREAEPYLLQLGDDVDAIVDEILQAETVGGVTSLKSHDNYSFEHPLEVTVVGVMLGRRLGLSSDELRELALGCVLHDIGKLFVPAEILNKPGRLTEQEREVVCQHPQIGYELVKSLVPDPSVIARHVVWQHHERQDGTGYPRGLNGRNRVEYNVTQRLGQKRILLAAELAAVADVYSAIASDRPYRPAMKPLEIVSCLREVAGRHLNREIVERFLSILPPYPIGTEVVVTAGRLRGYRGVVTSVDAATQNRPTVRFVLDPDGRAIDPFEVDTSRDAEIKIGPPPHTPPAPRRGPSRRQNGPSDAATCRRTPST